MNQPPYIVTDIFTGIVAAVSSVLNVPGKLNKPVYSYYGYVTELNESLEQLSGSPNLFDKKFPLIWLAQPFTIVSDSIGVYGKIDELRMFIITDSRKDYKSKDRVANVYKPVLYPIQYELFNQMNKCKEFAGYNANQNFKITDHYYWGENQKSVLNDVVDTIEVRFQNIKIHNNKNCLTT